LTSVGWNPQFGFAESSKNLRSWLSQKTQRIIGFHERTGKEPGVMGILKPQRIIGFHERTGKELGVMSILKTSRNYGFS
jgi:hypothetical protein